MNNIQLSGNLTRDPELRHTQGGTAVCSVSIASNEKFKSNGEWQERVNYFDLTIWGKQAESFAKFFHKGKPVLITGSLKQDRWEDKETGKNRSKVQIMVSRWEFFEAARTDQSGRSEDPDPYANAGPGSEPDFAGGGASYDPDPF